MFRKGGMPFDNGGVRFQLLLRQIVCEAANRSNNIRLEFHFQIEFKTNCDDAVYDYEEDIDLNHFVFVFPNLSRTFSNVYLHYYFFESKYKPCKPEYDNNLSKIIMFACTSLDENVIMIAPIGLNLHLISNLLLLIKYDYLGCEKQVSDLFTDQFNRI